MKSVGWFQHNSRLQIADKIVDPADSLDDAKSPQDGGQHRLGLHDAKLICHAHPATSSERYISVRVSANAVLGRETIWVEALRVRKVLRVAMSCVCYHHGVAACWQDVTIPQVSFLLHLPEQIWYRWEQAECFFDYLRRKVFV